MGKLIYSAIASLDGYVEDDSGSFDWAAPDDEVHAFVNDLERTNGTYLYGRRMYETMSYWETADVDGPGPGGEYARIWQAAEKVVYSRTLTTPTTSRTRVESTFDAGAVEALKAVSDRDLSIGGSQLGGQALAAGLVDECQVVLGPITVGGGKPVFPRGVRVDLELLDEQRFAGGSVWLRYAVHR